MLDEDDDQINKADQRRRRAAVGGNAQGLDRERGKAVHPQGKELDEGIAALPFLPGAMGDRHGADATGGTQDQPLHVGVAVFVDQHLVHNEAPHGKIARDGELPGLSQHDLGHAVIEDRTEVAPGCVLLVGILGVDHVVALFELADKLSGLVAGGLSVVVETHHDLPRAVAKARHDGRVLAEVFGKVHGGDPRVILRHVPQHGKGIVRGAVVDQHELAVVVRHGAHGAFQLLHHALNRVGRAVAGDHKGYKRHLFSLPRKSGHKDHIGECSAELHIVTENALDPKARLFVAAPCDFIVTQHLEADAVQTQHVQAKGGE